jgi:pimeloyl-ACP methyl ester carboxylesterase
MQARTWFVIFISLLLGAGLCSCKTEVGEGDTKWNDSVAPYRKSLDMNGYTLRYIDMGTGLPVVMIHGFADSTYSWHENAFTLKDAGNRLIMVDLPGHGLSDFPPAQYRYSVENLSRAVITLTEKIGLKDFSLVGHDMGGTVALYIAEKHPEKVRRLAVLDPVVYRPPTLQILRLPGMEYMATRFGGPYMIRNVLENAYYDDDRVTDTLVNEYCRPLSRQGYIGMLASIEKDFYSPGYHSIARNLPKLLRPTLIIWGKQDTWVTQEDGRQLHEDMYSSTLHILDKSGHYPQVESSRSVNTLLMEFLKDAGPRGDQYLMTAGRGTSDVTLGISRESVKRLTGKPLSSTKNGDMYEGYVVRYEDDVVSEIHITSPYFHTQDGLNIGWTAEGFVATHPGAKSTCYQSTSGGVYSHGALRDDVDKGIAYERDVYQGKRQEEYITIIIHKPGTPARVYGTVTECKENSPEKR